MRLAAITSNSWRPRMLQYADYSASKWVAAKSFLCLFILWVPWHIHTQPKVTTTSLFCFQRVFADRSRRNFHQVFSIQNIRAWFHSWFLDNVLAAIAQFFAPNFYCIPKHLEPHQSKETHWRHVTCGSLFSSKIFIIIKYMETMTLQVSLGKGAPKSDKSLLQQTHFTSFTL